MPRFRAAAALLACLCLPVLVPASARAEVGAAAETALTLTYSCQTARDGLERAPVPADLALTLAVLAPESARAGRRLELSGTFSVTVPEPTRVLLGLSVSSLRMSSSVVVQARADGVLTPLPTPWESLEASPGENPLVLTGSVQLPAYEVPERASLVEVQLPDLNATGPSVGTTSVSVNLRADGRDLFGNDVTHFFACRAPAGASSTVARVPVTPQASQAQDDDTDADGDEDVEETPVALPAPPVPLPPAVESPPLGTTPPASTGPTGPTGTMAAELPGTTAPAVVSVADWGVGLDDSGARTISTQNLALLTVCSVAVALAWTAWSQVRLRRLRGAAGGSTTPSRRETR